MALVPSHTLVHMYIRTYVHDNDRYRNNVHVIDLDMIESLAIVQPLFTSWLADQQWNDPLYPTSLPPAPGHSSKCYLPHNTATQQVILVLYNLLIWSVQPQSSDRMYACSESPLFSFCNLNRNSVTGFSLPFSRTTARLQLQEENTPSKTQTLIPFLP